MNPEFDKDAVTLKLGKPSKVLVSACLMGKPVRYNGSAKPLNHPLLEKLAEQERLVVVCPELSAGFSVPRPPAEISDQQNGDAVLAGLAKVVEATGGDVTNLYVTGAHAALKLAVENGCLFALLVDGSPSFGSGFIYDGSFGGRKHAGFGITAALLRRNGIEVFSAQEIEALERRLSAEANSPPADAAFEPLLTSTSKTGMRTRD